MPPRPSHVGFLLLVIATFGVVTDASGDTPFDDPAPPIGRIRVMIPQGGTSLAPYGSSAALERAIDDGMDWLEVEIRQSRDGRHVLFGDDELSRGSNGSGNVATKTIDELKRLDVGSAYSPRYAGTPMLELGEALRQAKGRINLHLVCRSVHPGKLAAEIGQAGMTRHVVISGSDAILDALRAENSGELSLLIDAGGSEPANVDLPRWKPAVVSIPAGEATPARCRAWHDRGIIILARASGTEDRPEVWESAIEAGADWIVGDRPDEIKAREAIMVLGPKRVRLTHHRGTSHRAPENTLEAYRKAAQLGADLVEFDVRTSRDGVPFLLHDSNLDRTTDGRGPIRERDAAEVARLDAGSWFANRFKETAVPTLDTFLSVVDRRMELYVDAKDIEPEMLVNALKKHHLIDRAIVYQSPDYLAKLRAIEPKLRRMPALREAREIDELCDRLGPYAFDVRWALLSRPLIERCHTRGVQVFSDALILNETAESYRMAVDAGIDAIQTDHPLRVLRALAAPR